MEKVASKNRLVRAWECIATPEYLSKAQQNSLENGDGMSIFRFMKPKETGNCEYYYADKGCVLWNTILEEMPNRHDFEKVYKSSSMYAVCVSVPIDEHGEDTIQTVRLFLHDTNKEVTF